MTLTDKLSDIFNIIEDVKTIDPGAAAILIEGFGLSLNLIKTVAENNGRETIDVSEHLEIITSILGISLKDLVATVITQNQEGGKEPDQATLEFITSDLDDYEKFLAQNKAKEDLDFLSKEI
jgi:hypothetical protein